MPKNARTIKIAKIWFPKIWKGIMIAKFPYVSDKMNSFLNSITWNIPKILSKKIINKEPIDKESKK